MVEGRIGSIAWTNDYEMVARRWVSRNMWRVETYFGSVDDAVQEAGAIFARCIELFQDKPPAPGYDNRRAQFTKYYKTALSTKWIAFAKRDSAMRGYKPEPHGENNLPRFFMVNIDENPEVLTIKAPPMSDAELIEELLIGGPEELKHFVIEVVMRMPEEMVSAIFDGGDAALIRRRVMSMCKGVDVLAIAREVLGQRARA